MQAKIQVKTKDIWGVMMYIRALNRGMPDMSITCSETQVDWIICFNIVLT
jgi:hypothetical protein